MKQNRVGACPICGVSPRDQHSLRESARCDWLKRSVEERKKLVNSGESSLDVEGKPLQRRKEAA